MRRPDFHLRRYQLWQMAGDGLLIVLAYFLAFQLRFLDDPGTIPSRYLDLFFGSIAFVVAGKIAIFYLFGLYQKWWRFIGGRDIMRIVQAVTISSLLLIGIFAVAKPFDDTLPRSVAMTDYLLTMMLIAGARLATRLFKERPERGSRIARGREVLVIGAGSGGQMVVRELRLNPNLGETAIGFVDDNTAMRGMRIEGISVLGTTDEIETILDETEPDQVVIAIPSAPGTLRAKVVVACRDRQIPVRTLPTVFELLRGGVQLSQQLREVQVEDVLGREPVVVELERVGAYLEDQVVLVTGAGGSIGSELCRQIARVNPRLLVMLDHAEDNLFQIEREMVAERHFSRVEAVLADCKEAERMFEVMQRFRPSVVFHAAAYKHVPLMESNPLEAVQEQRDRHPDHGRDRGSRRGGPLRPDFDRQGRRAEDRDGRFQGTCRMGGRVGRRAPSRDPLRQRALRQRARIVGLGRADLPQPDRTGRTGHGHPSGHDPVLHDYPGGGAAGDPCRRYRQQPRGRIRPRHG